MFVEQIQMVVDITRKEIITRIARRQRNVNRKAGRIKKFARKAQD
jgi:hypothetical protein